MLTEFLRAQAGWRLANAGRAPVPAARCAAALLDAAAYAATLGDDDPDLAALERAGCFRCGVFDPGPDGLTLTRWWQYRGTGCARPRELIAALAATARAAGGHRSRGHCAPGPAAGTAVDPARV
jgi:hypothetical protein